MACEPDVKCLACCSTGAAMCAELVHQASCPDACADAFCCGSLIIPTQSDGSFWKHPKQHHPVWSVLLITKALPYCVCGCACEERCRMHTAAAAAIVAGWHLMQKLHSDERGAGTVFCRSSRSTAAGTYVYAESHDIMRCAKACCGKKSAHCWLGSGFSCFQELTTFLCRHTMLH